jgi:Pyridoxamine 5'-phosphate oxidase
MASWNDIVQAEPEFAAAVQRRFDAHRHKTLATLRADGSPRISGVEATFGGGQLWLGMMPESRKALDLRRDSRLALHSASTDPEMAEGDAKLSGTAEEVSDPSSYGVFAGASTQASGEKPPPLGSFHLFRVDIADVVLVRVGGDPPDRLVIETWREGRGVHRVERR